MRALIVSEIFPPRVGGSGQWLWELYRRLPRSSYQIVAGEHPQQESFDDTHDLQLSRLPLSFSSRLLRPSSLPEYWRALRFLTKRVREERISVVHSARCLPEGLLAVGIKWLTGTPFICYAHGEEVNLSNQQPSPRWHQRHVYSSREVAAMVALVLGQAQSIIANSQNTRSILVDRWRLPDQRVRLLHPGVDTERFKPASRDAAARARLGWDDRPVLLTVGRLQKRKGQDVMIQALSSIRQRIPDVLYAIVGDGEESSALQDLITSLQLERHVQILRNVGDDALIECYQQCDLFVLPNRQLGGDIEGFGMVLLEAQACAKPVIAGASGGTSETMQIPVTGITVPCDGAEPLASRVAEILGDEKRRRAMGLAGRDWVTSRFDWQAISRQAEQIFLDKDGKD